MQSTIDIEALDLNADALMNAAAAETGLANFGDEGFIEPLKVYLESVGAESQLTDMGELAFKQDTLRLLVNRLKVQDALAKNPEILEEKVDDPIIIMGIPRTGTTKLQRMIASDPQIQSLPLWRIQYPAPLSETGPEDVMQRIALAAEMTRTLETAFPGFLAAHPMEPEAPEEEALLQHMSFTNISHPMFYRAPSYYNWILEHRDIRNYTELRASLQYIQWQDGGRNSRPWVLKSPIHLGELDHIVETFPNATLVYCHRDPVQAVPSFCGLMEYIWLSRGIGDIDLDEVGSFFCKINAEMWRRNLQQRHNLPSKLKSVDLHFDQIRSEPLATIQQIYELHGLEFTAKAKQAIAQWEKENPADKFGKHTYTLERYGLSADSVRESFEFYYHYFAQLFQPPVKE